eukprot:gene8105-12566_t
MFYSTNEIKEKMKNYTLEELQTAVLYLSANSKDAGSLFAYFDKKLKGEKTTIDFTLDVSEYVSNIQNAFHENTWHEEDVSHSGWGAYETDTSTAITDRLFTVLDPILDYAEKLYKSKDYLNAFLLLKVLKNEASEEMFELNGEDYYIDDLGTNFVRKVEDLYYGTKEMLSDAEYSAAVENYLEPYHYEISENEDDEDEEE